MRGSRMTKLLNTLYVTTEGAYLRRDGETVAIEIDGTVRARMPCHLLSQIVLFGETTMSRDMIALPGEAGSSVAWLTFAGKLAARVEAPQTGNDMLRRAQHRATDDPATALLIACQIAAAKVANQRALLRRYLRDDPNSPTAEAVDAAQRRLVDAARHAMLPTRCYRSPKSALACPSSHLVLASVAGALCSLRALAM